MSNNTELEILIIVCAVMLAILIIATDSDTATVNDLEQHCKPRVETVFVVDTVLIEGMLLDTALDSAWTEGMRNGLQEATRLFQRQLIDLHETWFGTETTP